MGLSLKKRDKCPIHDSYFCCGRPKRAERIQSKRDHRTMRKPGQKKGWTKVRTGLWRVDDTTHPRGYRERRNDTAMKSLLIIKIQQQGGMCAICGSPLDTFDNVAPDHIDPRGAGGQWRDDHESNIQAVHHFPCNVEKGSKRNYQKPLDSGLSTDGDTGS